MLSAGGKTDHVHKGSHLVSVIDRHWGTSAIIMVKEQTPAMASQWEISTTTIGQMDKHHLLDQKRRHRSTVRHSALRCEQHIPSYAHIFSHMSTARVMDQENRYVCCAPLSFFLSSVTPAYWPWFSDLILLSHISDYAPVPSRRPRRTWRARPQLRQWRGFGHLANTTPRTDYEPNFIHETDTTIFDQTDDDQENFKCFRKSLSPKKQQPQRKSAASTVPTRQWEQRDSEIALHESHRELECQRLQLCQANTWADNAHREGVVLCGELERRNNLFQEDSTKHCREIAELQSSTSENGWIVHDATEESSYSESALWLKSKSCRIKCFLDRRQGFSRSWNKRAAPESHTLPVIAREFRVPEICVAAILDCRLRHGMSWEFPETFFERLPAHEGDPQDYFENSNNLASSSRGVKPIISEQTVTFGSKVRPEQQD